MKPTPRSHHPHKLLTNYVTSICVNDYLKYILGYKYQHTKVWRTDYKQEILCFLRILFKYTGVSNLKLFTIWVRKPIYVVFIIGLCKYLLIPSTQFWPWDFFEFVGQLVLEKEFQKFIWEKRWTVTVKDLIVIMQLQQINPWTLWLSQYSSII